MNELIHLLTLDEKLMLLTGKDIWHTATIDRLHLSSIRMADGPHGLRKLTDVTQGVGESIPSVAFPTLSALATTWNLDLAYQMAEALADECKQQNVDVLLGPGTNIKRTPLCGRNFEYFSEDPYLSGKLASSYIQGLEDHSVASCLKHFAANNQEFGRMSMSSDIDLRTLREIYFKPFEMAIKDSHPSTIMCAYNKLNGTYCSQNKWLLQDILRDTLNFEGIVISDWWAVHDRTAALLASLDLQMPYTLESFSNLKSAYENGEITMEDIDTALTRILTFIETCLENRKKSFPSIGLEFKHQLAEEIALESMVLLKNENNILPISSQKIHKLSLIGEYADKPFIQGGGSAKVNPIFCDSTFTALKDLAPDDLKISLANVYATWLPVHDVENIVHAVEVARDADMAIVFVGNGDIVETESLDREHIKLKRAAEILIREVAKVNPQTVVVLQVGSAIDMSNWIDKVQAVVLQGYAGGASGLALAKLLLGHTNPSGKLTETYPLCLEDCPAYEKDFMDGISLNYKEGIMVGYRYYDTYYKEVAYPFGFGLSYTSFSYSNIKLIQDDYTHEIKLSCSLTNTGLVYGKEIAQLYVHRAYSKVLRPDKELKGFQKVGLAPGEKAEIIFLVPLSELAYFDISTNSWQEEPGSIDFLIGASSRDIRLIISHTL